MSLHVCVNELGCLCVCRMGCGSNNRLDNKE